MSATISGDFFRKLRASSREAAGVPSYDPSDPMLPDFPPTLCDAVSGLDRSTPPYLRCDLCGAKLIRGLQSTICVYCGAEPRRELPISLTFNSTIGYRMLLESLDLDGTELVTLNAASKDSNKGKDATGEEVVLSSLFELEMKWPREVKKDQSSSTTKAPLPSTRPVNLAGIDLDNFFSEASVASPSNDPNLSWDASQVGKNLSLESHVSSDSKGLLDDFDSLRSAKVTVEAANMKGDSQNDSFAGWESSFQSAGSADAVVVPISTDLFEIPSKSGAPAVQVNTNEKGNSQALQTNAGHWKQHDHGAKLISGTDDDWTQDDAWQSANVNVQLPTDGSTTLSTAVPVDRGDPFDVWQDFTSSQGASKTLFDTLPGNKLDNTSSNEATLVKGSINMPEDSEFGDFLQSASVTGNDVKNASSEPPKGNDLVGIPKDFEFSDFLQSDSMPGVTSVQKDFSNLNDLPFESTDFSSLKSLNTGSIISSSDVPMDGESGYISATASQPDSSTQSSVEALLSQMHDLSFMLEDKLCIPKTVSS